MKILTLSHQQSLWLSLTNPLTLVPPPPTPSPPLQELGLIRKPASFMTSICDERGQELIYAGMPITEVFKEEMGLGGVLGLLWFQRR